MARRYSIKANKYLKRDVALTAWARIRNGQSKRVAWKSAWASAKSRRNI